MLAHSVNLNLNASSFHIKKLSIIKCVFCGWGQMDFGEKTLEELQEQFFKQYNKVLKNKKGDFRLKFYVSGSFFDNQVPLEFFNWL